MLFQRNCWVAILCWSFLIMSVIPTGAETSIPSSDDKVDIVFSFKALQFEFFVATTSSGSLAKFIHRKARIEILYQYFDIEDGLNVLVTDYAGSVHNLWGRAMIRM